MKKTAESVNMTLAYHVYGSGVQNVLAFHGYGQEGKVFEHLTNVFPDHKIIAFDLFFHGDSQICENSNPVDERQLKMLVTQILKKEGVERFSMVAFSIGAKFALSLVSYYSKQIERIVLLAPDGVRNNFWYKVATGTVFGRMLLGYIVKHPWPFEFVMWLALRSGVVDKRVIRFAQWEMRTEAQRQKVYNVWVYFRKLRPDISHIAQLMNDERIVPEIVLGKNDKIILKKHMAPLISRLKDYRITELPCGHSDLVKEFGV